MILKMRPVLWLKKAIFIFFIVWVGGLAPLFYVENFSSHRGVQRVQLSLFKEPGSVRLPIAVRQILTQHGSYDIFSKFNPRPQFVARNLILPEITSSLTVFHDSYLLANWPLSKIIDVSPWGRVFSLQFTKRSVYLPLPEKPPPFPSRLFAPC